MAGLVSTLFVAHSCVSLAPKRNDETPFFQICCPGSTGFTVSVEVPWDADCCAFDEHATQKKSAITSKPLHINLGQLPRRSRYINPPCWTSNPILSEPQMSTEIANLSG